MLAHNRTSEFIAEKFWLHFVSPNKPQPEYINQWAKRFRESNYKISVLMADVVASEPFWEAKNRAVFIKSPIEFTLGLLREFELTRFTNYKLLDKINNSLGQRLFYPPDVKSWRGGNNWINNSTFLIRNEYVRDMLRNHMGEMPNFLPTQDMSDFGKTITCLLKFAKSTLGRKYQSQAELLKAVLTSPTYQLR